jgi:hypothetical protein
MKTSFERVVTAFEITHRLVSTFSTSFFTFLCYPQKYNAISFFCGSDNCNLSPTCVPPLVKALSVVVSSAELSVSQFEKTIEQYQFLSPPMWITYKTGQFCAKDLVNILSAKE